MTWWMTWKRRSTSWIVRSVKIYKEVLYRLTRWFLWIENQNHPLRSQERPLSFLELHDGKHGRDGVLPEEYQKLNIYILNLSQTKIKYCLKWRQPPIEDNLQILKIEYLSNHWSDLPQFVYIRLGDQTKIKNCLTWRLTPMKDNLKILTVEYLSNHWSDLPQM